MKGTAKLITVGGRETRIRVNREEQVEKRQGRDLYSHLSS